MTENSQKHYLFQQYHDDDNLLILPNAWDGGSAKILTHLGFKAIATTSAGLSYSKGHHQTEGIFTLGELLDNAHEIMRNTHLPVQADLEQGGGLTPYHVADCVKQAYHIGLSGCTIEDATYDAHQPIMDIALSAERIQEAVRVKNNFTHPFMLTARAENYSYSITDLADTIKRLQAFDDAGADILYAPGLTNINDITAICAHTNKPVNVVIGYKNCTFTIDDLRQAGVARISLGSSLARAAISSFYTIALKLKNNDTIDYIDDTLSFDDITALFTNK